MPQYKIVANPQRNTTVYNIWENGMRPGNQRVAENIPNKELAATFAAAPAMLAELQSFVDRWSKYQKPPTGDDLKIYLENARAVIAQATETP